MPKQTPDLPLPSIQLDASGALPLHRQLYAQLSQAIRAGRLAPGTRLPSSRALARELDVSRTTILEAYHDLAAEGYLEGEIGAGTHVARQLPEVLLHAPSDRNPSGSGRSTATRIEPAPLSTTRMRLSQRGTLLATVPAPAGFFAGVGYRPFQVGLPALDAFPQQVWARAVARAAHHASTALLGYQHPAGYRPLREAIAAYLTVARGVHCTADQVIIVAGTQMGLALVAQLLLDAHDAVWMEDPGYPWAKAAFQRAGATLVPVPIDAEGIDVAFGRAACADARLAYVTPSHQFPLGVTMSLTRRYELLSWAQQSSAWIIEDDYDSEYRYNGRPIPALQGLDETGRVIYLGTFSKVLFPALRLGYIVAPPALVDAFVAARRGVDLHPAALEQAALAAFIADGHFTRHIRRMRALYAERGEYMRTCAARYLGDALLVEHPHAGLHVVGWLPERTDDRELARNAARHGVDTFPLTAYRLASAGRSGLLLGYAAFTEQEITAGMQRLAHAWSDVRGQR
jgi:GntR family transcriptional regulator/MocR family aminotransferase